MIELRGLFHCAIPTPHPERTFAFIMCSPGDTTFAMISFGASSLRNSGGPYMSRRSMKPFNAGQAIRITVLFLLTTMAHMACHGQATRAAVNRLPFFPGEKLTFQVRWSFIPAGKVVLEILPVETLDGLSAYHFVMTAQTYPLVDVFYKVRDRIDSYTDTQMTRSLLYREQSTGRRPSTGRKGRSSIPILAKSEHPSHSLQAHLTRYRSSTPFVSPISAKIPSWRRR